MPALQDLISLKSLNDDIRQRGYKLHQLTDSYISQFQVVLLKCVCKVFNLSVSR